MTVYINGKDAKKTWGIVFDSSSISALMTPAAMKDYVENTSRLIHGKKLIINSELAKLESRSVTLTFALYANNESDFFSRYNSFCTEIQSTGKVDIKLSAISGVVYKCVYKSCSQFTQYNNKLAKFSMKVEEYNPADRTE